MVQPELEHPTLHPKKEQITIPSLKPGVGNITTGISFEEARELAYAASEYLQIPIIERLQRENCPLLLAWVVEGKGSNATNRSLFATDKPTSSPKFFQDKTRLCAEITVPGSYLLQIPTTNAIKPSSQIILLRLVRSVK